MQVEEKNKKNDLDTSGQSKMIQGSAWMTAGSILSRILGALYIIPWRMLFGEALFLQANALYVQGYNVYSLFLIISIAGIPSAIAKQVAHYNALNEYGVGIRLYKRGLLLSAIMGVVCALTLYFGAPLLDGGNPNVIPIMHSLAWAVLVIPTMSLTRGYFQGYQDMAPSAISQFAEQLIRVVYMLLSAFLILKVFHGSWIDAVSQSTFAAFIGALAGLAILALYYFKRKKYYDSLIANSDNKIKINTNQLYVEIISQAVPFIVLASGITIFQLIDQYTFFKIMHLATNYSDQYLNALYTIFAGNANKLIMITISLASAMAITVVPLLSEAYTRKNNEAIKKQISNGFVLFTFVMLPASLGMAAVAGPLNRVFYGTSQAALSANVLAFSSVIGISFGLFTVIAAMMQGISQNKRAVKFFVIGTIAKIITQFPFVFFFGIFGPLLSSAFGFIVANYLIIRSLDRQFGIEYDFISDKINKILVYSIATYITALIVVHLSNKLVGLFMNQYSSVGSFIVVILAAIVGGYLYILLSLKNRLADDIIGSKMDSLRRILKIK
ncbi:putative polysaccharide biosynthesis protein [Apilactobacillus xinyiensis]|uniref:putative polysaccharide biosynthesis protein n=1 Tax=Apilactobacillus xinyiensis TaxID=2841032 RepID=UPI001C7DB5FE|nr:polysaccharide biosynthesis protein [Apilactobacillus xinyiensis]